MTSMTAAGSTLAISIATPATFDTAGYTALTFTEIGGIEKLGALGASFEKVEFQPLKGPKEKYKGPIDYGALQPSLALDSADAGQTLLQTSADDETQKLYSFKVVRQDGTRRFFQGRTFGMPETIDGAATVVMGNPTIEICTKIVKAVAAV